MNQFCRFGLLGLIGAVLMAPRSYGQTAAPTDTTDGWSSQTAAAPPTGQPKTPKRVPYRVIRRRDKQRRQAFVQKHELRHAFGRFYRSRQDEWFVLSRKWGIRENEPNPYLLVRSPALDRATFQNHFPYWQDRGGVYYARLMYFQQKIDTLAQADQATFRSLDFENLAVDRHHVYHGSFVVPGIAPATLRVYTPDGQRYGRPVGSGDAYLLGDTVGYITPLFTRLSAAEVRRFQPPEGYQLAYPLPDSVARPQRRR
jgi:hypothetical protein